MSTLTWHTELHVDFVRILWDDQPHRSTCSNKSVRMHTPDVAFSVVILL